MINRLVLFSENSPLIVDRVALNGDQIEQYNPPPNPAKVTDSRAAEYIARHGTSSWELDALEPQVLEKIIKEAVGVYTDAGKMADRRKVQDLEKAALRRAAANIHV